MIQGWGMNPAKDLAVALRNLADHWDDSAKEARGLSRSYWEAASQKEACAIELREVLEACSSALTTKDELQD